MVLNRINRAGWGRALSLLAVTCLALAAGCTEKDPSDIPDGLPVTVCVRTDLAATRGTVAATATEKAVSYVDWLVYEDGSLLEHKRTTGDETSFSIARGTYVFYAVVNGPDEDVVGGCSAPADLLALQVAYTDYFVETSEAGDDPLFCMIGNIGATLDSDDEVVIPVRRVASRIELAGIRLTDSFNDYLIDHGQRPSSALAGDVSDILKGVFITDIPETVSLSGAAAGDWFNECNGIILGTTPVGSMPAVFRSVYRQEYHPLSTPWCRLSHATDPVSGTVYDGTFSFPMVFYAHPNGSPESATREGEDHVTKLVVWVSLPAPSDPLDDVPYGDMFYVVGVPGLSSNGSVSIPHLQLNMTGEVMPNLYPQTRTAVSYTSTAVTVWGPSSDSDILMRVDGNGD